MTDQHQTQADSMPILATQKMRTTLHIERALHERVRAFIDNSKTRGFSLSSVVDVALREYLNRVEGPST